MEKLAITTVSPSVEAFVNLRIYDGRTSSWFDNLSLPKPTHPYITRIIFTQWYTNHNTTKIGAIVPYFPPNHPKYRLILTAYDIMAFVHLEWSPWSTTLIDENDRSKYPRILQS